MRTARLLPLLLLLFLPGAALANVANTSVTWCIPASPCEWEGGNGGRGGPGVGGMAITVLHVQDGGVLGNTVTLTADVDCLLCVFRWDMGDGTIRSGRSVTHTYAIYGLWADFLVELRTCTFSEAVCETRTIPIRLFHGPAIVLLASGLIVLLWLLRRKVRYQVVRM